MTSKTERSWIIAILFTGVLTGALDISIVGPAISAIKESIVIDERYSVWIFSIYVLFNLMSISLFARLSDIFGRKKIYLVSIVIFMIGSVIVSFADSFDLLLIGRAVQGFGSGGFLPVASAVVGDIFPKEKRGRILGLIGMVFGIAFIIGPFIAGLILMFFKWNVLFLINIPIAVLVIIASIKYLPNTKSDQKVKIDWWGIIGLGASLGLFVFALNSIDSTDFFNDLLSMRILPLFAASVILILVVLFIENRTAAPIIKTKLFLIKQIRLAGTIAFITGAMQSVFVFLPDYSVNRFEVDASTASFMLTPLVISIAVGSPLFGRLIDDFGSKIILILGLLLCTVGFYMLHLSGTSKIIFYLSSIIIGLGLSIPSGSSLRYIMLNEVGFEDRAITQGLLTIFIILGQLTGAALIGVIVASAGNIEGYKIFFYTFRYS
jgi:EmrB/QacA subfamily drug resistance transporter